ncbi:MAG: hypothetical protein KatS3mg012_1683 [Gaiellaceae bacterium]|jgi:hypothetical protein|nr:MAG: hypothetical protein KatS3mg012_1683 [Gaiellaceae bacterium]
MLSLGSLVLLVAPVSAEGARPSPGQPPRVSFSGYEWVVKEYTRKLGPGPNIFSAANVRVDEEGRLHLRISRTRKGWTCAEVINTRSLGYGTYSWTLASPVDGLDRNVVLGLFTWSDDPAFAHREIDWEAARWGVASDPTNGQYVVQPYDRPGNLQRVTFGGAERSTQSFTWRPGSVTFTSTNADVPEWTYTGPDVPEPGDENARMNLWLFRGLAPSDGREVEIVLESFSFTPLATTS